MSQNRSSKNPAEPAEAPPDFVSESSLAGGPAVAGAQPETIVIEPEAARRIDRLASEYVATLISATDGNGEFARAIAAIDHLGERDFLATAAMSGRILDRRFRGVSPLLEAKGTLARQLAGLRKAAAELNPAGLKLGGRRSTRDELAELDRYFERFAKAQPRLEATLASLTEGRLALDQDNAAILVEQASLATEMETLRQYAYLAGRIDDSLTARADEVAATDATRAEALRLDVLPVVRRRRREILTQLAVVTQGYAALRIVEDSNAEVIRALASAIGTTTAALRTAAVVASAAASQRLALEQLEGAREAASEMAEQAAALEAEASGPGGRMAVLRAAWSEVDAALDRVDAQKAQMLQTIASADRELTHPGPSQEGS